MGLHNSNILQYLTKIWKNGDTALDLIAEFAVFLVLIPVLLLLGWRHISEAVFPLVVTVVTVFRH